MSTKGPVPAALLIIIAMFLVLLSGAIGFVYSVPLYTSSFNANSNVTQSFYRAAIQEGYNYTISQIQSLMRQASEAIMGISAFMIVLGVMTWFFVYRPDSRGQFPRASLGALMMGILYILVSFEGIAYDLVLCLIGGALLIYSWYRIRSFSRALAAQEAAEAPATPGP